MQGVTPQKLAALATAYPSNEKLLRDYLTRILQVAQEGKVAENLPVAKAALDAIVKLAQGGLK